MGKKIYTSMDVLKKDIIGERTSPIPMHRKKSHYDFMDDIKNNNLSKDELRSIIKKHPAAIMHVKNASDELKWLSLNGSPYCIQSIRNPSPEMAIHAYFEEVKQNRSSFNLFRYIPLASISADLCKKAIGVEGSTLSHIPPKFVNEEMIILAINSPTSRPYVIFSTPVVQNNRTERIDLAIVAKSGLNLRFISNPSDAVMLAAVNQNNNAKQFIHI